MKTMGQRIHMKRTEMGWTMEQLAQKVGVQRSAINKWEKGTVVNINRSHIAKMAALFDVSVPWLMGFDDTSDVIVTYSAPGKEDVKALVDKAPIMGVSAKRVELYQAALDVKPENYDIAIQLLKTLQ